MKNKRGIEILHENVLTILVLVFIFVALLYFVSQQASGKLTEKQVLGKEICMITLASKAGTTIIIEHSPEILVEKKDNGIFINEKEELVSKGYFYDCYGNFEINSIDETKIEIKITR